MKTKEKKLKKVNFEVLSPSQLKNIKGGINPTVIDPVKGQTGKID